VAHINQWLRLDLDRENRIFASQLGTLLVAWGDAVRLFGEALEDSGMSLPEFATCLAGKSVDASLHSVFRDALAVEERLLQVIRCQGVVNSQAAYAKYALLGCAEEDVELQDGCQVLKETAPIKKHCMNLSRVPPALEVDGYPRFCTLATVQEFSEKDNPLADADVFLYTWRLRNGQDSWHVEVDVTEAGVPQLTVVMTRGKWRQDTWAFQQVKAITLLP
jgi:hypothetical protein